MSDVDISEIRKALTELPDRDNRNPWNATDRAGACDYFRTLLISADIPPEQVEEFLKYVHSEPFRASVTDDDLVVTSFEAMLAVDEGIAP